MFQTTQELTGKVTVIQIPERLDLHNSEDLKILFNDFAQQGHYNWVIDLHKTEYLDSSGLGAFVSQISECRSNHGDIYLAAPSEFVQSLLEITHLNKVLKTFNSVQLAVNSFS